MDPGFGLGQFYLMILDRVQSRFVCATHFYFFLLINLIAVLKLPVDTARQSSGIDALGVFTIPDKRVTIYIDVILLENEVTINQGHQYYGGDN